MKSESQWLSPWCLQLCFAVLLMAPVGSSGEGKMATITTQRLVRLRALMSNQTLMAYLVPTADAHQSEYISGHDARRAYISGFTGSAGTVIVAEDKALLWTDGRYYLQAEAQLDDNWELMRESLPTTLTRDKWLVKNLPPRSNVGANPVLVPNAEWEPLRVALTKAGHTLVPVDSDLIDEVWDALDGDTRPPLPANVIFPLEIEFTGKGTGDKLETIRAKMAERNASMLIVTALDEVAYLLNFRGSDIPYNPVFFTYCVVTPTELVVFTRESLWSPEALEQLKSQGVGDFELRPYQDVFSYVRNKVSEALADTTDLSDYVVWVSHTSGQALHLAVTPQTADKSDDARRVDVINEITPLATMKAVKNNVEAEGFIACHIRDGAALARYFSWLEDQLVNKSRTDITEISGADQLEKFRSALAHYMGLSFSTISASGPNGAVIHYKPEEDTNRNLSTSELYLCDSGAQFKDGTTDVTRTLHFGTPTQAQREAFTLVLKGQITLANAVFPLQVKGNVLDTLARHALWQVGLDYAHGTGHGVGHFLNVHEGPMGISWRQMPDDPGLQENMFLSNEPGYYEDGEYGIRLEDIIRVTTLVPPADKYVKGDPLPRGLIGNFNGRGALGFHTVTMCPIQKKMIVTEMLTEQEIAHVNSYHSTVFSQVSPLLQAADDQVALAWLEESTMPL